MCPHGSSLEGRVDKCSGWGGFYTMLLTYPYTPPKIRIIPPKLKIVLFLHISLFFNH